MIDINLIDNRHSPIGGQISGISALAQRVSIVLQTKASELLRENEGTSLRDLIGTSQADISYVSAMLSSVVTEVIDVLRDGNDELPDDEALNTAYISNISINGDSVSFTLTVVSRSGDTYGMPSSIGDTI